MRLSSLAGQDFDINAFITFSITLNAVTKMMKWVAQ